MHNKRTDKSWNEFLTKSIESSWGSGSVQIAGEQIVPHFQPIIGITSGRIVGYECLARSLSSNSSPRSFGHAFLIQK